MKYLFIILSVLIIMSCGRPVMILEGTNNPEIIRIEEFLNGCSIIIANRETREVQKYIGNIETVIEDKFWSIDMIEASGTNGDVANILLDKIGDHYAIGDKLYVGITNEF